MSTTLKNFVLSAIIAIVVFLGCMFLGGLFLAMNVPIASVVGAFLKTYGTVIGVLAGIWYFFTH